MKNIDEFITNIVTKELHEPLSYDMAIKNAFKDKKKSFIKTKIMKIVPAICSFVVIATGFVYAKDIENYFKTIFTNSTGAIDKAVENGYVQQENMDYIYDKEIGIKVDSLVLDDLNLDIAFNFETKKKDIKSICLRDFTITNDNNKVVYRSEFKESKTLEELPIYNSFDMSKESMKLTDNNFVDSILIGLRPEADAFKELYFDVTGLNITYIDDTREVIDGNWKFDITISEEMRKSANVVYVLDEENEYVESCRATISNTGTIIELYTKEKIPTDLGVLLLEKIYLKSNEKIYNNFWIDYNEECMIIHFSDVGKFIETTDRLELYLDFFGTTVNLIKKNI